MNLAPYAWKFWRQVEDPAPPLACWTWRGERQSQKALPYGLFAIRLPGGPRFRVLAHKAAWMLHHGRTVPDGYEVAHTCHNALCVRPSHLTLQTHIENVRASLTEGRRKRSS